jgi:5-methylcytosine-specific restriction endonuclease McrA
MAKGLCKRCYSAQYAADNSERVSAQKHEWYVKAGGKDWAKVQREQRHYGGLRDQVLARDGYRCVLCGSVVGLVVHHKDQRGRGHKHPNNNMNNLETRCRPCHMGVHRPQLNAGRNFVASHGWSPKYGLDACKKCHRSDRPHNAKGLCTVCYMRESKRYN